MGLAWVGMVRLRGEVFCWFPQWERHAHGIGWQFSFHGARVGRKGGSVRPHVLSLARDLHQPIAADCSMVHILVTKAVLAQAPNHFHAPAPAI